MSDKKIPSFIKVDPRALIILAQEAGIKNRPPIENKGGEHVLYQEKWDQWTSKNKTSFKWPSFVNLFKAQGNDDNTSSLSIEDLKLTKISNPKKVEAEKLFVAAEGYPEAVIMDKGRQILRMSNGQFWVGTKKGGKYTFRQIARQEGRKIEAQIANSMLHNLDSLFRRVSPAHRLYLKTTMGHTIGIKSTKIIFGGSEKYRFADKDYRLGNLNAKIAYQPGNKVDKFFLYQPQNGCVAASILNGAIFSESGITNDPKLLTKFYNKLKKLQGSRNGRIAEQTLVTSINRGKIPGLSAQRVKAKDVERLVKNGKPIVAIVPYFSGHAFLITDVNSKEGYYKAVDTVTGMMVQECFRPYGTKSSKGTKETDTRTVKEYNRKSIDLILKENLKKYLENPEFQQRLRESVAAYITGTPQAFYSFEVKDVKKFLAWLDS